ncbi:hypothetical protein FOA52_001102 [Chlamydomonas sp. UWO 241]|nr:hypothetical protein FOA52_001102 [Chlamydomonas sp. UWO 241]
MACLAPRLSAICTAPLSRRPLSLRPGSPPSSRAAPSAACQLPVRRAVVPRAAPTPQEVEYRKKQDAAVDDIKKEMASGSIWESEIFSSLFWVVIIAGIIGVSSVLISVVYFVQGLLGLSRLALSFFYKDELGVDPATASVLMGLATLPWMVKPLYGFVSDSIPLFGYRRRSYLVACGLLGASSWTAFALLVDSPSAAVAAMLCASLSTAFSDVVVDSIVVERTRNAPPATAGSLQSLCWTSASVGGITSAYFSGSLVSDFGARFVFGCCAVFPLIVSASALLIDEQPVRAVAGTGTHAHASTGVRAGAPPMVHTLAQQFSRQGAGLWSAIRQKQIFYPAIFVFLWQASPSCDSALFYFQTNELGFQPEFLGRVRLAGSIASLCGVALYNVYLKRVPLKKMLMWCLLLGVAFGSTTLILVSGFNRTLGISDQFFVLGDSVMLTVLGQISFMPILVLAARMCPEGVEATLFATLMSILNGGGSVGAALGAALTSALGVTSDNFNNLFLLVALCNAAALLPLPFLRLLPSELDRGDDDGDDGDKPGSEGGALPGGGESVMEMRGLLEEVETGGLESMGPGSRHPRL